MPNGNWSRNKGIGYSRYSNGRGGRGDSDRWSGHSNGGGPKLPIPALSDLAAYLHRTDRESEEYVTPDPPLQGPPPLEPIPLSYSSPRAYLRAMQQHVEAEYYAAVQQGRSEAERSPTGSWLEYTTALASGNGATGNDRPHLRVQGADFETDSWSRNMVEVEGHNTALLVTFCKALVQDTEDVTRCSGQLVVRGLAGLGAGKGRLRSLGYVGSYLIEYQSAEQLLQVTPLAGSAAAQLLRMVSAPTEANRQVALSTLVVGGPSCQLGGGVPCNEAQAAAVRGLRPGLDIIHGPPGSGKSTTIWHLINSRVGQASKCLVTCSRNQAVNAVVEKVASFGCLVFGSEARMGEAARGYTLAGRLKRDPEVLWWRGLDGRVTAALAGLEACSFDSWWRAQARRCFPGLKRLAAKEEVEVKAAEQQRPGAAAQKRSTAGLWLTAMRSVLERRYAARWTDKEARRLQLWRRLAARAATALSTLILPGVTFARRRHIVSSACVFLCTIDSSARMVQSLEEAVGLEAAAALQLDTCIVDEAGCVLESSIPVILRWQPANIVLVGDHCQLQPFSLLQSTYGTGRPDTHHSRSLLERAVDAGLQPWLLSIQYRMPDRLSSLVSRLFYGGRLARAPALLARAGAAPEPCRWVDVDGKEVCHQGKGYSNPDEVQAVVDEALAALRAGRSREVFVATPYNKQRKALRDAAEKRPELAAALAAGRLQVLSVDACQGSEADCVVLSLVRSRGVNAFLEDRRRLCVALSRARRECVIVGSAENFARCGSDMWQQVTAHFARQQPAPAVHVEGPLAGLQIF